MQYGFFDDENREYVITDPRTPLPWINYLGNQDFFSLISNTCGGYSFYKDAKLLRITRYRYNNVPADTNGRYYFINDGKDVWTPGWQPVKTELDSYECRHGLGYSRYISSKNQLRACLTAFVPLDHPCEVNYLTLTNESSETKELDLASYVEFCFWNAVDDANNFQRNLSIGEVEVEGSTIYHKTEYRERRNHFSYYSVNVPVNSFETSRDAFLGVYGSIERPQAVLNNQYTNSFASGGAVIGSHHIQIQLAPGETKDLIFVLGYGENSENEKWEAPGIINKTPAKKVLLDFREKKQVEEALSQLKAYWSDLLSRFHTESSDAKMDRMVNIWNQYQCMVTFNMSRSASYFESGTGRGMGFRDSCQDLLGFVHLIPERARERILDIAATQFENGSAYHQYQPLTKKGNSDIGSGFNDDPLWLIAAVSAYIRETGDLSILQEPTDFDNDPLKAAPLFEHLYRSFHYTLNNLGPHGLPLIGRADWNDCLNLNCFSKEPGESFQITGPSEGPVAESVFIAGMFVKYGKEYADLCRLTGRKEEAELADAAVRLMEEKVIESGWDGEWFLRAYDATGEKVGSHECKEGKIYIEPQGFCVMAGIGASKGLGEKAMESVHKYLETKYGVMILQPAYESYHLNLGEISSYPPGYKENAGIFCHNNPWISIAETTLGHGEAAYSLYRKICPAYLEEISEIHRTEPYVYSQMIAGKDAPKFGEAKNSWLTGTAAWTFVNISQYILGIQPELAGLSISPCLPAHLKDLTVTRYFRGQTYKIHIKNLTDGTCRRTLLTVNGTPLNSNVIPYETVKNETGVIQVEAVVS